MPRRMAAAPEGWDWGARPVRGETQWTAGTGVRRQSNCDTGSGDCAPCEAVTGRRQVQNPTIIPR